MSIYTDEGVPMMAAIELAIRDHVEGGTTWPANEDGSEITVALQGGTWLCTIKPSGASFEVLIERGECVRFYSKLSHILARVRELAEAARDSSSEEPADEEKDARIYKCADCGTMRSEREGGKIFTVCDECWNKAYPRDARLIPTPEQIENARNKIPEKLTTGLVKPVEEAPQPEPTLREFLVEFRKWLVGGIPSDLRDWLDARLGKEGSDG